MVSASLAMNINIFGMTEKEQSYYNRALQLSSVFPETHNCNIYLDFVVLKRSFCETQCGERDAFLWFQKWCSIQSIYMSNITIHKTLSKEEYANIQIYWDLHQ